MKHVLCALLIAVSLATASSVPGRVAIQLINTDKHQFISDAAYEPIPVDARDLDGMVILEAIRTSIVPLPNVPVLIKTNGIEYLNREIMSYYVQTLQYRKTNAIRVEVTQMKEIDQLVLSLTIPTLALCAEGDMFASFTESMKAKRAQLELDQLNHLKGFLMGPLPSHGEFEFDHWNYNFRHDCQLAYLKSKINLLRHRIRDLPELHENMPPLAFLKTLCAVEEANQTALDELIADASKENKRLAKASIEAEADVLHLRLVNELVHEEKAKVETEISQVQECNDKLEAVIQAKMVQLEEGKAKINELTNMNAEISRKIGDNTLKVAKINGSCEAQRGLIAKLHHSVAHSISFSGCDNRDLEDKMKVFKFTHQAQRYQFLRDLGKYNEAELGENELVVLRNLYLETYFGEGLRLQAWLGLAGSHELLDHFNFATCYTSTSPIHTEAKIKNRLAKMQEAINKQEKRVKAVIDEFVIKAADKRDIPEVEAFFKACQADGEELLDIDVFLSAKEKARKATIQK